MLKHTSADPPLKNAEGRAAEDPRQGEGRGVEGLGREAGGRRERGSWEFVCIFMFV